MDYATVKQVSAQYVAQCSQEFARSFPGLFNEAAIAVAAE